MILVPESVRLGDRELLAQAATLADCPDVRDCSRSAIQDFSRRSGMDLATALLYDRIVRESANRDFMQRVQAVASGEVQLPLVGIVPGAFYRDHSHTGADGAAVAKNLEGLGCRVECVPVASFGPLAANAAIIHQWLEQHRSKKVALVSLSKGTADVKVSLALPNAAERFQNVAAWISVSGLPQGTPLVGWLDRQPLRRLGVKLWLWWRNQSYSVVEELNDSPGSPLKPWPVLPDGLKIVHVVGFPRRQHLTHPWAQHAYERLRPLGPNDGGGLLLADAAHLPGVVLPVWGADHYLQPAWDVTALLRRVFSAVFTLPAEGRQASQSASQPNTPPVNKSSA